MFLVQKTALMSLLNLSFFQQNKEIAILVGALVILLLIISIVCVIRRRKRFNRIEEKIALQMDLMIRAEEDINKIYNDIRVLSNQVVRLNNKLNLNIDSISTEDKTSDEMVDISNPYSGYKTTEGQDSIKSKNGKEYTVDELINTIV